MQFRRIERREFIALLGGAAAWPLTARAQQPRRMRRIGILMAHPESDPEFKTYVAAFRGDLRSSVEGSPQYPNRLSLGGTRWRGGKGTIRKRINCVAT